MAPKKAKPTEEDDSPASMIDEVFSKVEKLQEEKRENLTLIQAPLRTVLFAYIVCFRWFSALLKSIMAHPMTLFVLLPCVLVFLATSMFLVPHQGARVFQFYDPNSDGLISAEEFVAVSTKHFGTSFSIADVNQTMTGYFDDPAHHLLKPESFLAWWEAGEDEPREKHRFPYHVVREIEFFLADVIWWVGLGVLSSIGLGTGMHSGLFFLFPHIYLTCAAVDACGHTNFWTYPVNRFYGPTDRTFECVSVPAVSNTVSILLQVLKVMPWCVLWGAGTAMGEIPPYALSYAAAKEGKQTDELNEVSRFDILNRMKNWMLDKIQRYGFWAILLLAAWPNMAFDLCGMACGQFLLPFWTFFGATFIGKALIKVNGQALFFVLLFSGQHLHDAVAFLGETVANVVPAQIPVEKGVAAVLKAIDDTHEKIERRAKGTFVHDGQQQGDVQKGSFLAAAMQWIVFAAVLWFAKSIVDTFAQKRQKELDEVAFEEAKKHFTKKYHSHGKKQPEIDAEDLEKEVTTYLNLGPHDPAALWCDEFVAGSVVASAVYGFVYRQTPYIILAIVLLSHCGVWQFVVLPAFRANRLSQNAIASVRALSLLPLALHLFLNTVL